VNRISLVFLKLLQNFIIFVGSQGTMLKWILILVVTGASLSCFAQNTFLVEKVGTSRRYAFHLGDEIKIRTKKENLKVKSCLWAIEDSSVTIGPRTEIPLNNIGAVYKQFHFPKLLNRFFFIAGVGYFVVDSFNNLINNEQVFEPETMIISASLIAVSVAFIPLSQKKCRIGLHWKVKVLDIYIPGD